MEKHMNATLNLRGHQDATNLLLRHCLSLGTAEGRIPARLRLEEAIGPELTRRLITSLTARRPHHEPVR
jgi:hypothetical protein